MARVGIQLLRSSLVWCLLALGLSALCQAAETPDQETATALMNRAAEAEKACQTNEAITAYTRLLQRDSTSESVVGQRLVQLYMGGGQAADALAWATRVARHHPEPASYLAGVYARLGQWKDAELLLRKTLAHERDTRKRTRLSWQLADLQERQGDTDAARLTLAAARNDGIDEVLNATTTQRLEALKRRHPASETERPSVGVTPKTEGSP
jgi:lipopolysaccharide biosynthesis regulator YciM